MTNTASRLDPRFSLYLDAVRFIAAVLVVLAHFIQHGVVQGSLSSWLPNMGREAVIMFFVLSGFVIAYTTEQKGRQGARAYVIARCARIYSVALPVLLLAFACAWLASLVFGVKISGMYEVQKAYIYLPFHLLFLGELWNLSLVPPWLAQYWSLGYEVWYYVLFGVVFYLRGTLRVVLGAVVFILIGYKLWLLLPVWLSGVGLYHWQKRHTIGVRTARSGWIITLVLLALYNVSGAEATLRSLAIAIWPFPALQLGSAERFLADYLVCGLVFTNFLFARFADLEALVRWGTPIRNMSYYTFTLYLAHGVVMGAWLAFLPADGSATSIIGITSAIMFVTWCLSFVTEDRRDMWQGFFSRWPFVRMENKLGRQ